MNAQNLDATQLAADRTRLAHERTLMAWIRTSTSLIAFGFTIYQFFRYLSETERLRAPVISPQVFGFLMILIGLTALSLAWVQHHRELRALRARYGDMPHSLAAVIAALIAGLGVAALVGVALRL